MQTVRTVTIYILPLDGRVTRPPGSRAQHLHFLDEGNKLIERLAPTIAEPQLHMFLAALFVSMGLGHWSSNQPYWRQR